MVDTEIDDIDDIDDDAKEEMKKIDTSPAKIMAHIDIIQTCHFPIADNKENRKIFEEHICNVCAKIQCTGKGRCRATDKTFAQLNLLTPLVSYRDEGSPELGIEGFDRAMTIGDAIRPFNHILADYFDEEDVQTMHAIICISKDKDASLGKLIIPREYNVKVNKLLR
jgi:hypothetical protein